MRTRSPAGIAAGIAALGLVLCCIGPATAAPTAKPATHTVVIDGTRFDPETLTVRAGDTVVWVNRDPFPHTATSAAGGFDSREIPAGKSWKYKAAKVGVFPYACALHPTMKATLRVE